MEMTKRKPKGNSPKNAQELIRSIKAGLTIAEIASKYGVNKQTVSNWIITYKKQGYTIPRATRSKKCISDVTKLRHMLELLYIDICDLKGSIQNIGNNIVARLMKENVEERRARIMALGVMWFLEELINQYDK